MGSFTGIEVWIAAVVAAVGAILAWVAKSKRDGRKESDAKHAQETEAANVQAAHAHDEVVKETSDVKTNVNALPVGDAARELRNQWTRPDQVD